MDWECFEVYFLEGIVPLAFLRIIVRRLVINLRLLPILAEQVMIYTYCATGLCMPFGLALPDKSDDLHTPADAVV